MPRLGAELPLWARQIDLDRRRRATLTAQLVDGVVAALRRGQLLRGERLPPARVWASSLGVDRSTVMAAMAELSAQGLLTSAPRAGLTVAAALPPHARRGHARRAGIVGFDLADVRDDNDDNDDNDDAPAGDVIELWGGTPDVALVPRQALARALRRVLMGRHAAAHLGYSDGRGAPALRRAVASWLRAERGLVVGADDLLMVQGAQMGLDVVARALLRPGDIAVVEEPGYPPLRAALLQRGVHVWPVRVDADGLDVDTVIASGAAVRAVFVTPHHQYPTTVSLAPERRARLLAWAATQRVLVVEDDYDHEFHYRGRPLAPLAADDPAGVVVYVGSLSKILAPGLRKGFVSAPRPALPALVAARRSIDRQGDAVMENAIAELIDDGELSRHARRMRRLYRERRDLLLTLLADAFGDALEVRVPAGGMALWLRVRDGTDVAAWRRAARKRGVVLQDTAALYLGPATPALRLGFAGNSPARLHAAVARLVAAHHDLAARAPRAARPTR